MMDDLAPRGKQLRERLRVRLLAKLINDCLVQVALELADHLRGGRGRALLQREDGAVEQVGHRVARVHAHLVHVLEPDERHEHLRNLSHVWKEGVLELERIRAQHVARRRLLLKR